MLRRTLSRLVFCC